jgi:hypothetical protein
LFWICSGENGGLEKEKREQAPALPNVVIYLRKYITNYGNVKNFFHILSSDAGDCELMPIQGVRETDMMMGVI